MPSWVAPRPPIRRRGQNWLPLSRSSTRREVTGAGGVVLGGSALVDLSVPAVPSDVDFLWDFDNDGDFDEAIETFTDYVLAAESLTGRDFPSQLTGKATPGKLRITVNNDDDRFSFFNTSSPLNTDPFSLRSGRKIRVRVSEAVDTDPTLLARDRFNRATFASGTETGQTWTQPLSAFGTEATTTPGVGGAEATMPGQEHLAVIDVGATDYYAQVRVVEVGRLTTNVDSNTASLVYRYQDSNDYSLLQVNVEDGELRLIDVVAGTPTTIDSSDTAIRDGMTIGVLVVDGQVTAFEDGVVVMIATAIQTDETEVGIHCLWADAKQPNPVFDDFAVWTGLPTEVEGCLWTGEVTTVHPSVQAGPHKLAVVEAEGVLSRMAAQNVTPSPAVGGRQTGSQIGNILGLAGLLHPPGPVGSVPPGNVLSGPFFFPDEVKALDAARRFEEIEVGFIFETQEGYIGYEARDSRDGAVSQVTFSDNPGAQFSYESLELRDWRREVINRVNAGVAPDHVGATSGQAHSQARTTASGTANSVSLTIPDDVEEHDLVLAIIASGIAHPDEQWLVPIWWVEMRDARTALGLRVYSHISDGTDGGEAVTFYNDSIGQGGAWTAHVYLIKDWYGVHEGLVIAEANRGANPPAILPPWGGQPTMFIAARMGAGNGGGLQATQTYPIGYLGGDTELQSATSPLVDVALQTAFKNDVIDVEDPTTFTGFTGMSTLDESLVIAVRGFNGTHPPPERGILTLTGDDVESQDEHNAIKTNPVTPDLFNTEADAEAYIEAVLERYADDRPIFALTFVPTVGAHYRNQAMRRRVGDKITLVATENSGMGVEGEFFIESISHRFSQGSTLWRCTWELSPA